jgi:hypothetical protein
MSDDDVRAQLDELVVEAIRLRFDTPPPRLRSPHELLDALYDVRVRLDRVEQILSQAQRLRARARDAAASAEALAEEAWDRAAQQARNSPVSRDDYSSARERAAEANLAVLTERRTARAASALASYVDNQVDVLRTANRGLDGLRHDLLAALRAFQIESSLER